LEEVAAERMSLATGSDFGALRDSVGNVFLHLRHRTAVDERTLRHAGLSPIANFQILDGGFQTRGEFFIDSVLSQSPHGCGKARFAAHTAPWPFEGGALGANRTLYIDVVTSGETGEADAPRRISRLERLPRSCENFSAVDDMSEPRSGKELPCGIAWRRERDWLVHDI
jgi:hypothetical protein